MTFEESETRATWIVAQTRLGEESLTVIPLECNGRETWFISQGLKVIINPDEPAFRDLQLQLLRHSMRVSNHAVLSVLKTEEKPRLFTRSVLLKDCVPLWLKNGETSLQAGKDKIHLTLDEKLGLVISKDKGDVHE